MEKIFKDVFEQLVVLNDFLGRKVFTQGDLCEEKENYEDFSQTLKELNELLIVYKNTPMDDVRSGCKNLLEFHTLMDGLRWYVQNLHDRVIDVLKQYPNARQDLK